VRRLVARDLLKERVQARVARRLKVGGRELLERHAVPRVLEVLHRAVGQPQVRKAKEKHK